MLILGSRFALSPSPRSIFNFYWSFSSLKSGIIELNFFKITVSCSI